MNNKLSGKSKKLIEELYSKEYEFTTSDGEKFEVPESGSIGLLTLGYQGLIAWRKQRVKQ